MRWPWSRRVEQRATNEWGRIAEAYGVAAGLNVETLAAACSCISLISGTMGSLPMRVYRPARGGREEAVNSPLSVLLQGRTDQYSTAVETIENAVASFLLHGNALLWPRFDFNGVVTSLSFIPWGGCNPQLTQRGDLYFDVTDPAGFFGSTRAPQRVAAADCVFFKDRSDNGVLGRARLGRASGAVALALSIQKASNETYSSGLMPSALVTIPASTGEDIAARIESALTKFFGGASRAGRLLTLPGDSKFTAMQTSPESSELQAARLMSSEDIARIFNVPTSILWPSSSGNSFQNARIWGGYLARFCLQPIARRFELAMDACFFGDAAPGWHVQFDFSTLTRGDDVERWASYKTAREINAMTVNEIREAEGLLPMQGGDDLAAPAPAAKTTEDAT